MSVLSGIRMQSIQMRSRHGQPAKEQTGDCQHLRFERGNVGKPTYKRWCALQQYTPHRNVAFHPPTLVFSSVPNRLQAPCSQLFAEAPTSSPPRPTRTPMKVAQERHLLPKHGSGVVSKAKQR